MKKNEIILSYLEQKFANFNNYNKEIAIRKEEIKMKEADENIGASRVASTTNHVENNILKIITDQYILNRELWKKGVTETLDLQSTEVKSLIENKYWGTDSWMDWVSFGKKHGYSKTAVYRIRQKVLLEFGRKIGEIN